MSNDLVDKIPGWLKSLWHMENELRSSARNGLFLRKDDAATHLAEARRHLDDALRNFRGDDAPPPSDSVSTRTSPPDRPAG